MDKKGKIILKTILLYLTRRIFKHINILSKQED
jgi:hypothetical protein